MCFRCKISGDSIASTPRCHIVRCFNTRIILSTTITPWLTISPSNGRIRRRRPNAPYSSLRRGPARHHVCRHRCAVVRANCHRRGHAGPLEILSLLLASVHGTSVKRLLVSNQFRHVTCPLLLSWAFCYILCRRSAFHVSHFAECFKCMTTTRHGSRYDKAEILRLGMLQPNRCRTFPAPLFPSPRTLCETRYGIDLPRLIGPRSSSIPATICVDIHSLKGNVDENHLSMETRDGYAKDT